MALRRYTLEDWGEGRFLEPYIRLQDNPPVWEKTMRVYDTEAVREFNRAYDRFLARADKISQRWDALYASGQEVPNPNYDPEAGRPKALGLGDMSKIIQDLYTPALREQLDTPWPLVTTPRPHYSTTGAGPAPEPPLDTFVSAPIPPLPLTRWQRLRAWMGGY